MPNRGLHHHIRAPILIAWVVAWNVLFGLAFWLNDGFVLSPGRLTLIPAGVPGILSAGFAVLIACSPRVQARVLRPEGDVRVIRRDLWFIALVTGWPGIGFIIFSMLPRHA